MQAPQLICRNKQIQLQINTIKTQIWALEMGHDYLSRDDYAQIDAWNAKIRDLHSQMVEA